MTPHVAELLIVGGGPAGTAVLLAAARSGALAGLAEAGLVVAESGPRLGAGSIGRYTINSDSTAATFLAAVTNHPDPRIAAVAECDAARAIASLPQQGPVRLRLVAPFLDAIGTALHETAAAAGAQVLTGHVVLSLQREQLFWIARLQQGDAAPVSIAARQVVIATGGVQTASQVAAVPTVSGPLGALCGARLMRADTLMAEGGVAELCERVRGVVRPLITVVGGSTSALAAVRLVLESPVGARLATGALSLVHRRRLRPFYRSAEAALADGYTDFGPDDICPVSGFVFRLGGLRLDAREIVLSALRIGGREPDPRLRLVRPAESVRGIRALDEAHVVVAATGYRPRALPICNAAGAPVPLHAAGQGAPAMVDGACRVLDGSGMPLPNLFGIGLAAGFVPHGRLGGEKSFSGQANGLWLWQHDVGDMIVQQVCEHAAQASRQVA